ncbi:frizzled-3 isoform X3 [Carettochelys insculpta]|uniref:frizzled-3 isoform X3 n=1 Tax=Carettochelys insculpta TaxID=44489 RepID=UPI003EBCEAC3
MATSLICCLLFLNILMGHSSGHSLFSCEPIILRMCQDLPYNATFMPNLLNHYDQQTAALAMEIPQMSRPDLILFLMKYLMALVVGIPSVFWVGSKKTCFEWASFFHGRRKKETVNESHQVLQEPDFAQSLLRDPNTPIIRKSRGTSTQGTSTHASSTHLAMMDDQRSKAGSVHSKVSSYHGSLHRSRDGRYTPCSYRGIEDRLPHGSMSRLTDHSRHSSSHRLNEQSRHSSTRDLSNNPMTHITHGTSMNRVIEEDGTSA